MEQAFPATDRTWQAAMWRRFRRGEVATLRRTASHIPVVTTPCNCPACIRFRGARSPTWAEKVNKPVNVPVFDAKFSGCDVTHWRVPFGWIPAQNGDEANFRD